MAELSNPDAGRIKGDSNDYFTKNRGRIYMRNVNENGMYPPSPLVEGMLLHSLAGLGTGIGIE